MHRVGELQAVNTAGHLNIGEQHGDIRTGLKNRDCLVGVDSFDGIEPRVLYDVDSAHAENHLVFDDKNVRHLRKIRRHRDLNLSARSQSLISPGGIAEIPKMAIDRRPQRLLRAMAWIIAAPFEDWIASQFTSSDGASTQIAGVKFQEASRRVTKGLMGLDRSEFSSRNRFISIIKCDGIQWTSAPC